MSKTKTSPRYTVRPLGCTSWAECRSLAEARRQFRAARNMGLQRVVIVDETTGETVD